MNLSIHWNANLLSQMLKWSINQSTYYFIVSPNIWKTLLNYPMPYYNVKKSLLNFNKRGKGMDNIIINTTSVQNKIEP